MCTAGAGRRGARAGRHPAHGSTACRSAPSTTSIAALAGKQPGDTLQLEIDRAGGGERDRRGRADRRPRTTRPARSSGFVPFDTATVDLPFEIDIDTGRIGGPSAGLAFTLTLIDELSPGDLTGGLDVAVTGDDRARRHGRRDRRAAAEGVGRAPGRRAITSSSRRRRATTDLARAREIAGDDVEIIPVATLDEALAALERLGGDPLVPRSG